MPLHSGGGRFWPNQERLRFPAFPHRRQGLSARSTSSPHSLLTSKSSWMKRSTSGLKLGVLIKGSPSHRQLNLFHIHPAFFCPEMLCCPLFPLFLCALAAFSLYYSPVIEGLTKKPSAEQASQSFVVRRRRNKIKICHFWGMVLRNETFMTDGTIFPRNRVPSLMLLSAKKAPWDFFDKPNDWICILQVQSFFRRGMKRGIHSISTDY